MQHMPLSELSYHLTRDPLSYRTDFEEQLENFSTLKQSFSSAPSQYISRLEELLSFLSQAVRYYPEHVADFSTSVIQTLLSRSFGMHPEMRMGFLRAFMRLRTKNLIPATQAVDIAFKLYRCRDKQVRKTLRHFLVSDIKRMNKCQKQTKANAVILSFLSKMIKDNSSTVAREAVLILLCLFKKNVWNDARTANVIADSCLMGNKKVYVPAIQFFLGKSKALDEMETSSDSESDNEESKIKQLRLGHRVGVKTKGRQKRLERSIKHVNKEKERKIKKRTELTNFHALNMLHDPQTFAEKLFRKLERCSDRFEIRLLILDLISRLIGLNKLVLLNFYPFIQRFLRPQQREVTHLLLFSAQASHDQVPPDVMEPLIRVIADNFITERASSEAIAVGLNSVREICLRCPYAVTKDLLSDLIQYRSYRNKNVVAAARSIIRLYRQINPELLPRKECGRLTESQLDVIKYDLPQDVAINYGQCTTSSTIPGAEIVVLASEKLNNKKKESSEKSNQSLDCSEKYSNNEKNDSSESCSEIQEFEDETCSDSETDESDGEWVNLSNSSEEDDEQDNVDIEMDECNVNVPSKKTKIDPTVLKEKAFEIATSRIFTQEEFEAMRKYQQTKQKRFASYSSLRNKHQIDNSDSYFIVDTDDEDGTNTGVGIQNKDGSLGNLVSMSAITRLVKRPHQTKADRMESIEEGRIGREKYGFKVNRLNAYASTTNREKLKNKTFQMVKHKIRRKAKRSFQQKQIALRDHLKKLVKRSR
uniref:Protein SDA1 n=1 Tax=Schistosoma mansoni TaxID=6183 RepID=A0A3Q0KJP0_SCHMA